MITEFTHIRCADWEGELSNGHQVFANYTVKSGTRPSTHGHPDNADPGCEPEIIITYIDLCSEMLNEFAETYQSFGDAVARDVEVSLWDDLEDELYIN